MSTTPQSEGQPQPQPQPQSPAAPRPPAPYFPPPRSGWRWGRIFFVLVSIVLVGSLFLNLALMASVALLAGGAGGERKVQEKFVSGKQDARDKVAVIPIEGTILDPEDGFVKRAIDQAKKDENVKAVVVRVNSPGGSVTGSDYIYHHLRELKRERDDLPIVVSMGGIAASGGYYVSMAVGDTPNTIFAEPTGFTGSIGVLMPHYNAAGLMQKVGVESDTVASHPLKTMGSLTRPMTEQERKIFQALVDDDFRRFKDIVKSGRPKFQKDPGTLEKIATGQVFTADQAKENGLIDRIGFLEDAVDRAIELAGLDKEHVKVVRYRQDVGFASMLLGTAQARQQPSLDLQALLDMTTPRAYYLCTWLPGLGTAKP